MKIPLCYIPKTRFKKFLHIEQRYISETPIIPLGCDCHPAYMLKRLHLRTRSFPFDWMSVHALKGLTYVCDMIETHFRFFLSDLRKNEKGLVYSENYPYALFFHEKNLIDNSDDRKKLKRRADRFLEFLHVRTVRFLYMTTSSALPDGASVETMYESVVRFTRLMKESDTLSIYVKHEESLDENALFVDRLIQQVRQLDRTAIVRYLKQTRQYGLWGNEKRFPEVFERLGLPLRKAAWPKFYLK